jgi:macrolide transport system ATP-binding/permease protein
MDLLESMNRDGLTLVVVTHDAEIAARARRVVRLSDGAIVGEERRGPGGEGAAGGDAGGSSALGEPQGGR